MARPSFQQMWSHFRTIYGDGKVESVGNKIGGKVKQNIDMGVQDPTLGFTNACAIRMSYSLNNSGYSITKGAWKTVSGGDNKQYIFRVADLKTYLASQFGAPDRTVKNPKPTDFKNMKGIIVFRVQWENSTGHATLWDGTICSDHCYFPFAMEASIWRLN